MDRVCVQRGILFGDLVVAASAVARDRAVLPTATPHMTVVGVVATAAPALNREMLIDLITSDLPGTVFVPAGT